MSRDRLFLLLPGFEDPKQPGRVFFCPYSNQVEGVLASHPELAAQVEINRLPFPKPRQPVADLVGEENQSLPLLVLGDARPVPADVAGANGLRFVNDTRRILELLAERHGIPFPHLGEIDRLRPQSCCAPCTIPADSGQVVAVEVDDAHTVPSAHRRTLRTRSSRKLTRIAEAPEASPGTIARARS